MGIANEVCEGRVISVLEGGYNVLGGGSSPFALSVRSHVEGLTRNFYGKGEKERWEREVRERRRGVRRRNGMGSREGAKITMDVERRQKEFDFFVSCGWITSAAQLNE